MSEENIQGSLINPISWDTGEPEKLFRYIKGRYATSALYNGYIKGLPGVEQFRGILGAESLGFGTADDDGEYEGIRVTFRILNNWSMSVGDKDKRHYPIEIDSNGKLVNTDSYNYQAEAPFHTIESGAEGFYNTYANPLYNSNYVGYRRGEIYRFGLLL